jgi:hypothetical protein
MQRKRVRKASSGCLYASSLWAYLVKSIFKEFLMRNWFFRLSTVAVAALLLISCCWLEADAQKRTRRSRRTKPVITNPTIASPGQETTGEARVISTADETGAETTETHDSSSAETKTQKKPVTEQERMQQTIHLLSNQVERLNDKLSQMQENDRTLLDMERLTRAEQRAENLRTQLLDTESKLADLQGKLDQIEYSLRPEMIERSIAGYGSVHPEETRDTRRRQLENEKMRAEAQIRILETSKSRLEQSLITADTEVDRLRRKLELHDQQELAKPTEIDRSSSNPSPPK